jgi:hypothetical protein
VSHVPDPQHCRHVVWIKKKLNRSYIPFYLIRSLEWMSACT